MHLCERKEASLYCLHFCMFQASTFCTFGILTLSVMGVWVCSIASFWHKLREDFIFEWYITLFKSMNLNKKWVYQPHSNFSCKKPETLGSYILSFCKAQIFISLASKVEIILSAKFCHKICSHFLWPYHNETFPGSIFDYHQYWTDAFNICLNGWLMLWQLTDLNFT